MSEYNENMQNVSQYDAEMEPVMGIGQWMIITLVMSIPCVNIIMLFVWGFSSENRTRAKYRYWSNFVRCIWKCFCGAECRCYILIESGHTERSV